MQLFSNHVSLNPLFEPIGIISQLTHEGTSFVLNCIIKTKSKFFVIMPKKKHNTMILKDFVLLISVLIFLSSTLTCCIAYQFLFVIVKISTIIVARVVWFEKYHAQ